MMKVQAAILILAIPAVGLLSCKKDDPVDRGAQLRPRIEYSTLNASSNYLETFRDEAGVSTVDFSGQTTRQDMLAELDSIANLPVAQNKSIEASLLKNRYANSGAPFVRQYLNEATDKQLKNKTAQSFGAAAGEAERARLEAWMDSLAKVSLAYAEVAGPGEDGIITASNGTSRYLVSGQGIEYRQLVQKGLYTAVFLDQISNIYLGDEKQSLSNEVLVEGKNYTGLEHSWDEAYGYVTKNGTYPQPSGPNAERNFGRYLRQGPDSTNIFLAFLRGRAAAVNNDRAMMNEQISIIRTAVEKLVAMEAVSYLNKTKKAISANNMGSAIHSFNEGLAFVYGLRFAHDPKIDAGQSDNMIDALIGYPSGFYELTIDKINEVRNFVAEAFDLDPELEIGG